MGKFSHDLEAAWQVEREAEDRLAAAHLRTQNARTRIGRFFAEREVLRAGREVHDSGEHVNLIEDLQKMLDRGNEPLEPTE
jgi:hypothetical protein